MKQIVTNKQEIEMQLGDLIVAKMWENNDTPIMTVWHIRSYRNDWLHGLSGSDVDNLIELLIEVQKTQREALNV